MIEGIWKKAEPVGGGYAPSVKGRCA